MTTNLDRVLAFARERHEIYLRRSGGYSPPWTHDEILRTYRFCNVYRELDRVTIWIRDNWRLPNQHDVDLWLAMVVARFINWPNTLREIGYPVPWEPERFCRDMSRLQGKVYTGAYMVRADPETPGEPKYRYQERVVFSPMWEARERLRPKLGDTLNSYHVLLGQFHGLGSFMAGQVVADLKYSPVLSLASDWMTFAASGPGSRRGLNRVMGRGKDSPWSEDDWRLEHERLREQFNAAWDYEKLHGQDMQNVLCEFDKYERVRLGEGRPRSLFRPTMETVS